MKSLPPNPISAALALLITLLPLGRSTLAQSVPASSIVNTKHNLGASGPGPIRVPSTPDVCRFCHTPHASNPIAPLWNRSDPGSYYQTYESTTLLADVGQPTGSSRLCLSCHDGTIALTQTYNSRNAIPGSVYISPQDAGYLGTDLTDDHPISFVYDSGLAARNHQLRDPMTLPHDLPLDNARQLQCTTCHEPHNNSFGYFLRMDNTASRLCTSCHEITGWTTSPHAASSAALSAARENIWQNLSASTVAAAACESCHRPHSAGARQRLLRFEAEEDNCFICHDGSVASDIASQVRQPSAHDPARTTGDHDPAESALSMPEHVECADCHDPHGPQPGAIARAPNIKPTMAGASGVSSTGLPIARASFEYEVCYKCHRDETLDRPLVDRTEPDRGPAFELSTANVSFHPVEAQGRNLSVPSLITQLNTSSQIYCTDCHSSDSSAPAAGGITLTRPPGPHGSIYRPLLVRQYDFLGSSVESPAAYDLCYGCHERFSILGDQSFSAHRAHIVDHNTSCATCHDAHGSRTNAHLINFDRDVVGPSAAAGTGPTYLSTGSRSGSCTLSCHTASQTIDHVNQTYP